LRVGDILPTTWLIDCSDCLWLFQQVRNSYFLLWISSRQGCTI
jgi:hypothetical protein